MPRSVLLILRLEGAVVFAAGLVAYRLSGASWGLFALTFFLPDLAMLGYLRGPRVGALCYNLAHTYVVPALLAGLLLLLDRELTAAIIWAAHIGFDRAAGYGLKHATAFRDTHLGQIGAR